jgi:AAA family ATP:ADP antiporter
MKAESSAAAASSTRGRVDRLLGLFTRVKAGEGVPALLLALEVCVLLCAYYVLKPVREALILASPGGAELKSYAAIGQIALLAAIVPGYSALASRFERSRLIGAVTLVFVACLVCFYFLARFSVPGLGLTFFLWVGIFNLMVVAQFWAFASDLFSREQGERLFPIVAFGASIGAVLGSQLTRLLVEPLGIPQMMLVSAGLLLLAYVIGKQAEERASPAKPAAGEASAPADTSPPQEADRKLRAGGFRLVARNRYLLLLGLLMLLLNFVSTTGEFLLGSFVKERALEVAPGDVPTFISQFYSEFFFWVNSVGVFIQVFITSRFVQHLGVRSALLVLPVLALVSNLAIAFVPLLVLVRWTKTVMNGLDYSLNNTVRNALFLPLTADEKYKGKQVVDTVFVRAGDVLSAGLVFLGSQLFDFPLTTFALVNAAVVGLWLLVAWRLGRAYQNLAADPAVKPAPQ